MMETPTTWYRVAILILVFLSMAGMTVGLGHADDADLEADLAAAARGEARALFRLAARYETGDGVAFDPAIAATLLEAAAVRGDAPSQYRLGLLKAGGIGSEVDLAGGLKWLLLAQRTAPAEKPGLLGEVVGGAVAARLEQAEIDTAKGWVADFVPVSGPVDLPPILGRLVPVPEQASLRDELKDLDCGWPLSPVGDDNRTTFVAYAPAGGAVSDASSIADLRHRLADEGTALDIRELSAPICALRNLIANMPGRRIETGVSLVEAGFGLEPVYKNGDQLVVDVEAADRGRYVTIDYVVHSGEVLHLYPSGKQDGYLAAGRSLRLGDGSDGRQPWEISAPFGRDLLIVTLSEQSRMGDRRDLVANVDGYITDWRERMTAIGPGDPWYVFERVILTQPR